jgi:hypothetical protein
MMVDVTGGRDRRGRLAAVLAAGLLVSCSGGPTQVEPYRSPTTTTTGETPADRPGRTAEAPRSDPPHPSVPFVPSTSDPVRLGNQLERVFAVLHERKAPDGTLRRAAEFEQLAVSALARAPEPFQRRATRGLDPRAAAKVRSDVRAAEVLLSMGEPQPRLPDWRIVRPPPPDGLLAHYRRAQRRTGVHWSYLAAIHLVETRMGRISGVSTAGAVGPMQFLPTTWDLYGAGGDIRDPRDAILAAGRLLRANGAPGDMAEALWHYNPSDAYVAAVSAYARTMRQHPETYRDYWHWRVLYRHVRGTHVLPVGYPQERPQRLPGLS